jgi:hypothetical protein
VLQISAVACKDFLVLVQDSPFVTETDSYTKDGITTHLLWPSRYLLKARVSSF